MSWRGRFSPHTRGCSASGVVFAVAGAVFPAYAGMFRHRRPGGREILGFPRIRGDVPPALSQTLSKPSFSPHTRGCSGRFAWCRGGHDVFPAYAGMFRIASESGSPEQGFPRIRGDVPSWAALSTAAALFSPHTRGCSLALSNNPTMVGVFPAYAGMFPVWQLALRTTQGFPRIRGDVPVFPRPFNTVGKFSPHTRGCSFGKLPGRFAKKVFPAYAGMFLERIGVFIIIFGFPRIRGDVPPPRRPGTPPPRFSPHTRGCSDRRRTPKRRFDVFPAYAGMFHGGGK